METFIDYLFIVLGAVLHLLYLAPWALFGWYVLAPLLGVK